MRKGDIATLYMKKALQTEANLDERVYSGIVLQYDENKECIYIRLEAGQLTDLSLDAIYKCKIQGENERVECTGRIKERYCGMAGKTFRFEIENGFYKISLK